MSYSLATWIEKAKKIHGNLYEYRLDQITPVFVKWDTKVPIWCKEHQDYFFQSFYTHTSGKCSGCPLCIRRDYRNVVFYCIYSAVTDSPVYVGYTSRHVDIRLEEHLKGTCSTDMWLRDNQDNIYYEVLEEQSYPTLTEIKEKERYYISTLHTHISEGGLNKSWGGESAFGSVSAIDKKIKEIVSLAQKYSDLGWANSLIEFRYHTNVEAQSAYEYLKRYGLTDKVYHIWGRYHTEYNEAECQKLLLEAKSLGYNKSTLRRVDKYRKAYQTYLEHSGAKEWIKENFPSIHLPWTQERWIIEASKYATRGALQKGNHACYIHGWKYNLLDLVFPK